MFFGKIYDIKSLHPCFFLENIWHTYFGNMLAPDVYSGIGKFYFCLLYGEFFPLSFTPDQQHIQAEPYWEPKQAIVAIIQLFFVKQESKILLSNNNIDQCNVDFIRCKVLHTFSLLRWWSNFLTQEPLNIGKVNTPTPSNTHTITCYNWYKMVW